MKNVKPLTAAICAYVHHKGWCETMHREPRIQDTWQSGCPFKDAATMALWPPVIMGKVSKSNLRREDAKALVTPGTVILGD